MIPEHAPKVNATICLILALGLAACASSPSHFRALSQMRPADTFSCLMNEVNRRGWTVIDANRETGFVRAEKAMDPRWGAVLGEKHYTVATFSVYTEEGTAAINATVRREKATSEGRSSGRLSVVKENSRETQAVVAACGDSVHVSRQARS